MTVAKDKVVSINYTLRGDDGGVIDTSEGRAPLEYLHGHGMLLPKFEESLAGHNPGDNLTCDLAAKDGYGEYDESLVTEVPRSQFETDMEIEVGMAFQAMTESGPSIVTVTKVTPDVITVDANDSLAGKNLHFAVEVLEVRDATEDELRSGRPAGQGCGCGGCGGGCGDGGCGGDCGCGSGCDCASDDEYDSDEEGMPCPCGCGR
ncbi:MAG: peptidylprolyl isomerase [Treponema sp.]|nr:peptidylprolyl isomerase [Treponema sp.]MBQ6566096.1 peptidylprolyl isomerase [Treponema sp.]